jgi:hypothetical protein
VSLRNRPKLLRQRAFGPQDYDWRDFLQIEMADKVEQSDFPAAQSGGVIEKQNAEMRSVGFRRCLGHDLQFGRMGENLKVPKREK